MWSNHVIKPVIQNNSDEKNNLSNNSINLLNSIEDLAIEYSSLTSPGAMHSSNEGDSERFGFSWIACRNNNNSTVRY